MKLESIEDEQGGLVITGCRSNGRLLVRNRLGIKICGTDLEAQTVTPSQPAHCLFHVRSEQPRNSMCHMIDLELRHLIETTRARFVEFTYKVSFTA